jgi:hypothetical protein
MDTKFLAVGVLLIIVGVIRHFIPRGVLPKIGYKVALPGFVISGLGVVLVIAGLVLG